MTTELIRTEPIDPFAELDDSAWDVLQQLAESLHLKDPDVPRLLDAVVRSATGLVPTASAAGLNLYEQGRFVPQAVHGEQPPPLDELQQRTGDGPCIEAARSQLVVYVQDMSRDGRWPQFQELAESLGVLSMLCVPLRVDNVRLGSLSLYFEAPEPCRDHDVQLLRILAAQAALAISDTQRSENLRRALLNRDVIGQAKGILMERHRLTADQAFELLTRASQLRNRKLAAVAEEFVLTGELTGAAQPGDKALAH